MKRTISIFLLACCGLIVSLEATVVDVLKKIEHRAAQSQTDALLIVRQGKPVCTYPSSSFPRIDCREMARPILALAIGFLWDERFITSLDTPVSTYCPSWEGQSWGACTIRGLLADEGSAFYCLGDVVKAITGEEWQDYVQIKLFTPLGISRQCWTGAEGKGLSLALTAEELAKLGRLLIKNGEHRCKQLLSRQWVRMLMVPTAHLDPFLSNQWYLEYFDFCTYWDETLIDVYMQKGLPAPLVCRLKALNGRIVHLGGLAIRGHLIHAWGHDIFCCLGGQEGLCSLVHATFCHQIPFGRFHGGGVKSLVAWGSGGQQLIIVPGRDIVAVRQASCVNGRDAFEDFIEVLDDYIREVDCYID
jgi:CubicO group peptidase (beta-lactamase class C family)